jgi:hypothetical protein
MWISVCGQAVAALRIGNPQMPILGDARRKPSAWGIFSLADLARYKLQVRRTIVNAKKCREIPENKKSRCMLCFKSISAQISLIKLIEKI